MTSNPPCRDPRAHLRRVERPENIAREPLTLRRLLRRLPRFR